MHTNTVTKLGTGFLAAIITIGASITEAHADDRANREAAERARAAELNARIQAENARRAEIDRANEAAVAAANARAQQLNAERARQEAAARRSK